MLQKSNFWPGQGVPKIPE